MKTVYPQIESSAQVAGSKTRVVAEAKLVADKDKVWRDWNKKLTKWGGRVGWGAVVVEVGGRIMDAADWVMDPENNTITKRQEPPKNDNSYYKDNKTQLTGDALCYQIARDGGFSPRTDRECRIVGHTTNSIGQICPVASFYRTTTQSESWQSCLSNGTYTKPEPTYLEVTPSEIEQHLKNILNDPQHADLAKQMIGNSYTIGSDNTEPDPNIVNDIKDAQKGTLKSDDPKGDGRTRTDPKIDTGTEVKGETKTETKSETQVDEKTVTNPDGSTTTTGTNVTNNTTITNNTFELPAFCDYASKLCDWLDWTQEDKELEEAEKEEPEELDLGTIDKNRFSANGQCPAPKEIDETVKALGRNVNFDFKIEWTPICSVAEDTSPLVLLISTITGLLILVGGGRSSEP